MPLYAVTAVGVDRPGTLAALAGVLVEQGCNIEDSEMAVLRGHSAMMLVVAGPDELAAASLEKALASTTVELDLSVMVRPIDPVARAEGEEAESWSVSVHGADRPGIVYEVTRILARAGLNITGVKTRVHGPPARPELSMALDVSVPAGVVGEEVAAELDNLARRLNVACSMRPTAAQTL
jgi:glycine cleavage system transcriptional repressor